jgi:hypothetical protein
MRRRRITLNIPMRATSSLTFSLITTPTKSNLPSRVITTSLSRPSPLSTNALLQLTTRWIPTLPPSNLNRQNTLPLLDRFLPPTLRLSSTISNRKAITPAAFTLLTTTTLTNPLLPNLSQPPTPLLPLSSLSKDLARPNRHHISLQFASHPTSTPTRFTLLMPSHTTLRLPARTEPVREVDGVERRLQLSLLEERVSSRITMRLECSGV